MSPTSQVVRVVTLVAAMGAGVSMSEGALTSPSSAPAQDVKSLPKHPDLPDPLTFADGTAVKSAGDWRKRREELADLFLRYEYGRMPGTPASIKVLESAADAAGAEGTARQITLGIGPADKLQVHLHLMRPAGRGPFPVILNGDLCWGHLKPEIVAEALGRGYVLVEFDRTEIAPDKDDRSRGVYPLYPEADWGAVSAWAWGYERVIDYLCTLPDIDAGRIIITGHSRGGKAVLLAGALDERIALTVPNASGAGGGGCFRVQGPRSETLSNITSRFPYWFAPHFADFGAEIDRLPFDQHELKAMVAPRALLTTESRDDHWANPDGSLATFAASKKVFQFLGVPERTGIHFRHGPHAQTLEDWTALLDFADWQLGGKPTTRKFQAEEKAKP